MNGSVSISLVSFSTHFYHDLGFHNTKVAQESTVGAKNPVGRGDGQTHRERLAAQIAEERRSKLGQPSLHQGNGHSLHLPARNARGNDTKDGKLRKDNHSTNLGPSRSQSSLPPGSLDPAKDPLTTKKIPGRSVVSAKRPSPPSSLVAKPNIFTTYPVSLATPNTFMAAVHQSKPRPATTTAGETHNHSTNDKTGKHTQVDTNALDIRKVNVEHFSFPALSRLEPSDVSTHTDGAPSPVSTSELEDLMNVEDDSTSDGLDEVTKGLNGLGISDVGYPMTISAAPLSASATTVHVATPRRESIMDSPIPIEVRKEIFESNGHVLVYNGHRYVREEVVIQLRAQLLLLATHDVHHPDNGTNKSVSDHDKVVAHKNNPFNPREVAYISASDARRARKSPAKVGDESANFEACATTFIPPTMKASKLSAVLEQSSVASPPASMTGILSEKSANGLTQSRWATKDYINQSSTFNPNTVVEPLPKHDKKIRVGNAGPGMKWLMEDLAKKEAQPVPKQAFKKKSSPNKPQIS